MINQKRGQVTVFIIVGLIILISVGTTVYIANKSKRIKEHVDISKEVEPIVNYIEDCISDIAADGVTVLGAQGGYIYVPEDKTGIHLLNPHPNALDVFGNGAMYAPYWFYKTENGIQKEQIPSISSMENELERYVDENIRECIANFSSFAGYDIEGFNKVKTTVDIKDNKIVVDVESPTIIRYRDVSQEIKKFDSVLNIGLGKDYKKAREIYNEETKDMFLEKRTIDMMVLYDKIPFSGTDFDCGVKLWSVDNVKKDFKEIVMNNIYRVRLKENNLDETEKYFSFDVDKDNFDANFMYSERWPFYMEVHPSENGIMKGDNIIKQTGEKFMSTILCINNYHFVYDIAYPVLISLRDSRGYMFQFSYVVVIDNNQEREAKLGRESTKLSPSICDKKSIKLTVDALGFDKPKSGSINDGQMADLSGVDIWFKCFSTRCYIGKTNDEGSLTALFPQCLNGLLIGEKQGYSSGKNVVSTNVELSTSVVLEPIYNIEYDVKVIDEKDGSVRDVSDDERVLLELNHADDEDYQISTTYPDPKTIGLIAGKYHVKTYLIKLGNNLKLESQTIKKCVRVPKRGILGLFLTEEKCVDAEIKGSTIDSLITGGAEFEWDISRQELIDANRNSAVSSIGNSKGGGTGEDNGGVSDVSNIGGAGSNKGDGGADNTNSGKSKLIFYVMKSDTPKNFEELNDIYDKISRYKSNINFIYPEFIYSGL